MALGETKYYKQTVNKEDQYTAQSYAGNTPFGHTEVDQQGYLSGLQSKVAKAQDFMSNYEQRPGSASYYKKGENNPYVGQTYGQGDVDKYMSEIAKVQGGQGQYAQGYRDQAFSKYLDDAPFASEQYMKPEEIAKLPPARQKELKEKYGLNINIGAVAPGMTEAKVGNTTAYVPTGSAAQLQIAGQQAGTVSPNDPTQQFNAGMKGNNVNAPGMNPIAPIDLNAKYSQGLSNAQGQGLGAPTNGDWRSMVNGNVPPGAQTNPALDALFQTDPNIANFTKMVQDYMNPQTQQKTFRQEYESLLKEKGIEKMNTDLLNMKNVIEGAEDDLRTEITKAGGFATDSQVLALTSARNKTLIKNYNNLLQTKQQAENYIQTAIGLEEKDRTEAQNRMNKQLDLGFKLAEMQQSMQKNAQDSLQKIADKVGYDGLASMAKGDPYYTSLIEKTLGLGAGGLAQLSVASAAERKIEDDYKIAQTNKLNQKDLQFISGTENQRSGYFDSTTGKFTATGGGGGGSSGSGTGVVNIPTTSAGTAAPVDIKGAITTLAGDKNVKADTATQLRKGLSVLNTLESIATDFSSGFPGGPTKGSLLQLVPEKFKSEAAAKLNRDTATLRQAVVNYITGAAYTSLQESDVNKLIPQLTNSNDRNRAVVNDLYNTLIGDMQAGLNASGVKATLPKATNLFNSGSSNQTASPSGLKPK
jgi:hypothetical protein